MAKVQPERIIEKQILEFLRIIGIYCWKNQSQGTWDAKIGAYRKASAYSIKGASDILGIIQGRFLAIEVKSPGGVVTPEQRIFIARINAEGGISFISRSVEQTAENLLKFFPDNQNLKRFCHDYVKSGGHSDH